MKKLLFVVLLLLVFGAGGWWWNQSRNSDAAGAGTAQVVKDDIEGQPKVGDKAPMFQTRGALAGKQFDLNLAEELKKGPLVLYFFPKVFTSGCTAEAKEFADREADFAKMGASVVGMSADDLDGLSKFSREACRDKFPVAQATPEIIEAYDVKIPALNMTNRTSFVIAQDGTIAFVHSDLDYKDHVRLTYEAVQKLKGEAAPTT